MADTYAWVDGISKAIKVSSFKNAEPADTTIALTSNLTGAMVQIVGTIIREDAHFNGSVYEESTGTRDIDIIVPVGKIRYIKEL